MANNALLYPQHGMNRLAEFLIDICQVHVRSTLQWTGPAVPSEPADIGVSHLGCQKSFSISGQGVGGEFTAVTGVPQGLIIMQTARSPCVPRRRLSSADLSAWR